MRRREFISQRSRRRGDWVAARVACAAAGKIAARRCVGLRVAAASVRRCAQSGFAVGLQALGYSEDRNIALDVRYSGGSSDRAGEIATEFVRLGVDVIVAHFTPAVRAAMGATQTIPIVMVAGAPLQSAFIDSLARPGGNVTGLSGMEAEIGGKRLQLLRDLIPSLGNVRAAGASARACPGGLR